MQCLSGLSAMSCRRMIGLQVRRHLTGGRQQAVFLLMKHVMAFGQQPADLAGGNVDAEFEQLLVQQRLSDVVVKMLIQHVLPQRGAEMPGPDNVLRQRCRAERPVRQPIPASEIKRIVRLNDQILHGEVFVAEKLRSVGQIRQRQRDGLVDREVSGLAAFGRTGPLSPALAATFTALPVGRRTRLIQPAGLSGRRRFVLRSFQTPDFLLEPLDLLLLLINDVLLLPDDAQQLPDQRSLLLRKSLQHFLYRQRPCHPRSRTNSPISEKTNRHGVIEKSPRIPTL